MKNNLILLITSIMLFGNSFLFPQDALKQGVYSLSGSLSYSYSKTNISDETFKQSGFSIEPSLNYFLIDNLLLGSNISFNYSEVEFSYEDIVYHENIYRQFGIGPNIRYYFIGYNVIPFIGFSAKYSKAITTKQEGNDFSAFIGINYFISRSAALEPYLAYSISSFNKPKQDINTFIFGFRINYFIVQ